MPELPEVEAVCRLMRRALGGKRIAKVIAPPEPIVMGTTPPEAFVAAIEGKTLAGVGRRGKYWWLDFGEAPIVFGHLGMTGWVRVLPPHDESGAELFRLREHGNAPIYGEDGLPRFMKLLLEAEDGVRVALTDGRRLARLWLGDSPEASPRVARLGPDAYDALPSAAGLEALLGKRKAPIKALLLDQALLAGIGNWIADEVLFRARIAPGRRANTLESADYRRLHRAIREVLAHAVEVEADYERFPREWLFHHRWGGGKGPDRIGGREIVRETIGGRTTAWVPSRQK